MLLNTVTFEYVHSRRRNALPRSGAPNSPADWGDTQALPPHSVSKCIVLNQGSPGDHDELLAMGSGASKTPTAPPVIHAAPVPARCPVHEKLGFLQFSQPAQVKPR